MHPLISIPKRHRDHCEFIAISRINIIFHNHSRQNEQTLSLIRYIVYYYYQAYIT
jgi:hypothetical protein